MMMMPSQVQLLLSTVAMHVLGWCHVAGSGNAQFEHGTSGFFRRNVYTMGESFLTHVARMLTYGGSV